MLSAAVHGEATSRIMRDYSVAGLPLNATRSDLSRKKWKVADGQKHDQDTLAFEKTGAIVLVTFKKGRAWQIEGSQLSLRSKSIVQGCSPTDVHSVLGYPSVTGKNPEGLPVDHPSETYLVRNARSDQILSIHVRYEKRRAASFTIQDSRP